jgi:hypothetical protein
MAHEAGAPHVGKVTGETEHLHLRASVARIQLTDVGRSSANVRRLASFKKTKLAGLQLSLQ